MKIQTYKLLTVTFTFVIILLLIYIIHTNIKKDTILEGPNNSTDASSDNSSDSYTRLDTILKNLNYNYIYTYENFSSIYFSIAEYNDTNFSITEYKANNNDSINITIPSTNSFIISLPSNRTWTLSNEKSLSKITLDHTSTITDWKNDKPDGYMGILYGRDNFYFSTKSNGTETLQFKYTDEFVLNLNITFN